MNHIELDQATTWTTGFKIGKGAKLGDSLPHPGNWEHDVTFYEGMLSGLHLHDLDASMFLQVIPWYMTARKTSR